MNKIKVIDLLNMISKGEEVPKKIKYNLLEKNYQILVYDEEEQEYRYENDYNNFCTFPNHHLNDEVEIIEEEKKIPEKLDKNIFLNNETLEQVDADLDFMIDKINETIDYLDYLKSKGDE